MKIVHIRWMDAAHVDGWRSKKAIKEFIDEELNAVDTVGFLIHQDMEKLVIVQTTSENQVHGLFEIPRGCVREVVEIGEVEAETPKLD